MLKNWCFWTAVLERTLESPLDYKEIEWVHPKGNQSWIFIERTDAEIPILWPPDVKNWIIGKDPDAGKDWRGQQRGWDGWMASLTRWTWVWISSENWRWTGKPSVLQSMGSKRVRHTEWLNWTELAHTITLNLHINWKASLKGPRLPQYLTQQRIHLQCRIFGFDPWVGKIPWRRAWQPTPVLMPGEFHGQRNLWGTKSVGSQRVRHDWETNTFTFFKDPHFGDGVQKGAPAALIGHSPQVEAAGLEPMFGRLQRLLWEPLHHPALTSTCSDTLSCKAKRFTVVFLHLSQADVL